MMPVAMVWCPVFVGLSTTLFEITNRHLRSNFELVILASILSLANMCLQDVATDNFADIATDTCAEVATER